MPIGTETCLNDHPKIILAKMRKGLLWAGIIMILLGAAAIMMPLLSSLVVEILIGWLLIINGGMAAIGAFSLRKTGLFIWGLAAGLFTFSAGLLMLVFPLQGLIALTVLIAVAMVLSGVAQGAFALWARPAMGWGWGVLSAIISISLGGYILFVLPEASAVILGVLVGIDFASTGAALVLIARSVSQGMEI